jgi:recombination protein RecR
MYFNKSLDDLKNSLKQLPGVGEKTAQRYALFLLHQDKTLTLELAETIKTAVEVHSFCSSCNILSDSNPCPICSDSGRDKSFLCVVENTYDVHLIEDTGEYKGYYFVLGGLLSPMEGIGIREIHLPELIQKIVDPQVKEVILALNPSTEGETTIDLIASESTGLNKTITRLSTGLPFGGNIEYSNTLTLSNAIRRRYTISD